MILLDTDVLSALMLRDPEPVVVAWVDRQPPDSVGITAVTAFEIQYGIELLSAGRQRQRLEAAFATALKEDFPDRILPFDEVAARHAALLAARQRRAGRPVEIRDIQIAGIAAVQNATLATRNTRHFQDFGIRLVNPSAPARK
ncbi:MAG: type II toxin-antitoxin system VapC family toxin [Candidatus Coatesbacteria bacterium]